MDLHDFEGTGPVAPAHAFDLEVVERWLLANVPGFKPPLEVSQFRGGQSNPTFLIAAASGPLVLRRKPSGPTLRTAHAVDREFRITSVLHRHGIPVARPIALCDDTSVIGTPFFVMEHVTGRVHWNPALPDVPRHQRRAHYDAVARTLGAIHAVPIADSGLSDFGRPGDYFQRQISRWSEQYRAASTREIPAMDRLMRELGDHPPTPSGRSGVIHGDFRMDNIIFAADRPQVKAVIDWELSTLGDPLADLSYQCMVWHLPQGAFGSLAGVDCVAEGLPTEEEYLSMYGNHTGLQRPTDWNRCLAFNMFRLASILEGVARRALEGNASSGRATEMATLVEPIAARACELLD